MYNNITFSQSVGWNWNQSRFNFAAFLFNSYVNISKTPHPLYNLKYTYYKVCGVYLNWLCTISVDAYDALFRVLLFGKAMYVGV